MWNSLTSPLRAVVGLAVGGTSSTAGVLADDGTVLAVLDGAGANFRSSPGAVAEHVGSLLTAVAERVQYRVGPAGRDRAVALLQAAVPTTGLPVTGSAEVVTDPVVAYAAGAPGPDRPLLLAGTGAVALRSADRAGWPLPDVGPLTAAVGAARD